MPILLIIKIILMVHSVLDEMLNLIVEVQKDDDKKPLRAAIADAKNAKTKEDKIAAAKRISDSFSSNKPASGSSGDNPK